MNTYFKHCSVDAPFCSPLAKLLLLSHLLILILAGVSHAADKPLAEITLQLRWTHQFQFAGYYAALEKGYYEEAGFKVSLREGGPGVDTVQAVLDGSASFGVTNSEILLHRLNGSPLVALAVIFQHSPLAFIARDDTGITNPQDLIGKRVLMSTESRDIELHATLINEGVTFDHIQLVDEVASKEHYFNPAIDVLSVYITNEPYLYQQENIDYTIIKPARYGVDFYGDSLFTTEEYLRNNPHQVKAFRAASLKGWHYAMNHPNEMISLISEKYASKKSISELQFEAAELRKLILPELVEIGHMNHGRWQHIAKIFTRHKLAPAQPFPDSFLYNPEAAGNEPLLKVVVIIFAIISCLIGVALLFLYSFNRRLKREIDEKEVSAEAYMKSREIIANYNRQMEQFSLTAASVLSVRDEKLIGQKIAQAIVRYSDYERVLISVFTDDPPIRKFIGYAGVPENVVNEISKVDLTKSWYDQVFEQGLKFGELSYYIPHTMKHILNQDATSFGSGAVSDESNSWHPEDNLFVRMNDDEGNFIGVISVDNSKSGNRPDNETVRPLEMFSSLISQIIVLKREYVKSAKLEHQLKQAQKMEAIGILTGGIAHDFNNILGIIIGNAELALMDLNAQSPHHEELTNIKEAGVRARNIVQQLLSFSRKSVRKSTPLLLQAVIEESLTFMRSTIPSTIEIKKELSSREIIIDGDPTEIYQIIVNICTNATHAMSGGGTLTVNLDSVQAEDTLVSTGDQPISGKYAKIVISDTGHGIPSSEIDKVFDPYFTTKDVGKGTGIGLTVVHGIVKSHHGEISVSSSADQGTTFTILLPISDDPVLANVPEVSTPAQGGGSILFVDDEPSLLNIGHKMLEKLGYSVETFTDPIRALEQFKNNPTSYDLLITDFTMPGMTGDVLTEEVLRICPDLPVLLCTGYSELINQKQAAALGIKKYLKKPLSLRDLAKAVEETIQKNGKTN